MTMRCRVLSIAAMAARFASAIADPLPRLENLPVLQNDVRVREFTSFKRIAEVADYQSWLHVRDGERVIFFDEGPGRVTRFWITGAKDHDSLFKFYFDGETNASFSATPHEFFESGRFPYPVAAGPAQSAGGRICYAPFPYAESLVITDAGARPISYYNITFEEYPEGAAVETWDGSETYDDLVDYLDLTGSDPKPVDGNSTRLGSGAIAPGEKIRLMNLKSGQGVVQSIEFDVSPATPEILAGCSISMKFDGEATVDAVPLGEFFGSAVGELELISLPIGIRTNGDWYCYFPMPFWESGEIWIENNSAATVTNLDWSLTWNGWPLDAERAGYFHARRRSSTYAKEAGDLVLFEESGVAGRFVGLSLYMEGDGLGLGGMYYLEGDARVYIDGAKHPFIHGTGNEDWFNGAFYYNDYADRGANQEAELFSMPFHGLPAKHHFAGAENWTQAYRFNIPDPINWTSSMLFTIEHGQYPNYESGYYSCVAYSYQRRAPATYVGARVGAAGATDHYYVNDGRLATNTARFITPKAEVDAEDVTLIGFADVTSSRFSISVPPENEGVVLQFLSDFTAGTNSAVIQLDGEKAGAWAHVDLNYTNSIFGWGVSEIVLPSRLTNGRRRLDLAVFYSEPATEYGITARPIARKPEPGIAYLDWIADFVGMGCFTNMTDDGDGDAIDNLGEFAFGGDPSETSDAGFAFTARAVDAEIEFVHARRVGDHGLTYALETTENLVSNQWLVLNAPSTGAGELGGDFEVLTNRTPVLHERAFFRIRVESD